MKISIKFQTFVYLIHNRQTWQSYQMCQTKILDISDKNRQSKPNCEPQFIIRRTSNRGHYFSKVTQNLPMYRMYPADLCTNIFNGIYRLYRISVQYTYYYLTAFWHVLPFYLPIFHLMLSNSLPIYRPIIYTLLIKSWVCRKGED